MKINNVQKSFLILFQGPDVDAWEAAIWAYGGTNTYKLTIPNTTITRLIRYWLIPVPFFFLQKVDKIKKRATQINNLFLMNIPAEQRSKEINEAPSGYYWRLSFLGSKYTTEFWFLLESWLLDIFIEDFEWNIINKKWYK